ncbi:TdcF protein [Ilyonectria robusta]
MNPSHTSVLRSVARPNVLVFRASGTARLVTGRSIFGPRSSLISSTGHQMFSSTGSARKGMEAVFSPEGVTRQIPAETTGKLIEGTVAEKTHKMCQNARAVLEAAGSSLDKAVKITVQVTRPKRCTRH